MRIEQTPKYLAYIESDAWAKKRQEKKEEVKIRCGRLLCESCGMPWRDGRGGNVHHNTYLRLGEERLDDLNLLCRDCHALLSRWSEERRWADPDYRKLGSRGITRATRDFLSLAIEFRAASPFASPADIRGRLLVATATPNSRSVPRPSRGQGSGNKVNKASVASRKASPKTVISPSAEVASLLLGLVGDPPDLPGGWQLRRIVGRVGIPDGELIGNRRGDVSIGGYEPGRDAPFLVMRPRKEGMIVELALPAQRRFAVALQRAGIRLLSYDQYAGRQRFFLIPATARKQTEMLAKLIVQARNSNTVG